jgi:hypothetical protein
MKLNNNIKILNNLIYKIKKENISQFIYIYRKDFFIIYYSKIKSISYFYTKFYNYKKIKKSFILFFVLKNLK